MHLEAWDVFWGEKPSAPREHGGPLSQHPRLAMDSSPCHDLGYLRFSVGSDVEVQVLPRTAAVEL